MTRYLFLLQCIGAAAAGYIVAVLVLLALR